ncbi:O-methyltransferase [Mycena crocata]|nr:O-methyltransferase [Mycena crocata]
MTSPSALRKLSDIIAGAVSQIEAEYAKASVSLPSLNELFNPVDKAEDVGRDPAVVAASALIIAAAAQISVTVHNPVLAIINASLMYHLSSCLRAASALNVVEILREAGPEGLHAQDIAKKANTDPDKLARILRLLATHHVFREVTPDVFANNRISSAIDKVKPSNILFERPAEKFIGTSGLSAYLEHITDEGFKSSAYMTDVMLDPNTAFSQDPTDTAFSQAFATKAPIFTWYETPENHHRLVRFEVGQMGSNKIDPPESILLGFKWEELSEGSVLLDVGGGVGGTSLIIAKANPTLCIINQDRAPVIEQAKAYWTENYRTHVDSGLNTYPVHDFFAPQPVKNADIFLLRQIVHDWPDDSAVRILAHLRSSAAPGSKLVIVDQIIPYATESKLENSIPGTARPIPPAPLLRNMGTASAVAYWADMHKRNTDAFAAQRGERTIGSLVEICEKSGWKITQVYHLPGSLFSEIVAVPA